MHVYSRNLIYCNMSHGKSCPTPHPHARKTQHKIFLILFPRYLCVGNVSDITRQTTKSKPPALKAIPGSVKYLATSLSRPSVSSLTCRTRRWRKNKQPKWRVNKRERQARTNKAWHWLQHRSGTKTYIRPDSRMKAIRSDPKVRLKGGGTKINKRWKKSMIKKATHEQRTRWTCVQGEWLWGSCIVHINDGLGKMAEDAGLVMVGERVAWYMACQVLL